MKVIQLGSIDIQQLTLFLCVEHPRFLCCKDDKDGYQIAEKAGEYLVEGKTVMYSEFDLTPSVGGNFKFRLHFFCAKEIKNGMDVQNLAKAIMELYDSLIVVEKDDHLADFSTIYGPKGTDQENNLLYAKTTYHNDKL